MNEENITSEEDDEFLDLIEQVTLNPGRVAPETDRIGPSVSTLADLVRQGMDSGLIKPAPIYV